MKIAVEGCAHGELEKIYDTIKCMEEQQGFKIDLLICCGDFQASRNLADLRCMAVPPKYYNICSFYKYYNGEKTAPKLTIFIGGNHEASNYMQELPYGGWVAPNIYYLGYANVVNIAGIRIGGISGIYKGRDYMRGHFECAPFSDNTKRSVYHVRNLEVFRLKQLTGGLNIFLSHDWPNGIWEHGNKKQLLKFKPYFQNDINSGELGSKPAAELLHHLRPDYWFAAHLHCKFAAVVPHENGKTTKFLSLDKCLPKRRFLQIVDIPHDDNLKMELNYDLEWLTILRSTSHLLSVKNVMNYLPGPTGSERWCFNPTEEEKAITLSKVDGNLVIPRNFKRTAEGYKSGQNPNQNIKQPFAVCNPQTMDLCKKLSIHDPLETLIDVNNSKSDFFDDSCTVDDTTFINDTKEESVENITPVTKSILILPEPVMGNTEDDERESLENDGISDKPVIENDLIAEEPEETPEEAPSTVKKFKRRNASLYETTNENISQ